MIRKIFHSVGGLFVVSVLLTFIVWFSFVPEKIGNYLEYRLNTLLKKQGIQTEMGPTKTTLFGIQSDKIVVYNANNYLERLSLEKFYLSFLSPKVLIYRAIPFEALLYQGWIEGRIGLSQPQQIQIKGKNIRLRENSYFKNKKLILSNPTLNLESVFRGATLRTLQGHLKAEIHNLSITGDPELTKIPFKFPLSSFQEILLDLKLEKLTLETTIKSKGVFTGKITGSVRLNSQNWKLSQLNILVDGLFKKDYLDQIEFVKQIYADSNGKIKLKISGNLRGPLVKKIK